MLSWLAAGMQSISSPRWYGSSWRNRDRRWHCTVTNVTNGSPRNPQEDWMIPRPLDGLDLGIHWRIGLRASRNRKIRHDRTLSLAKYRETFSAYDAAGRVALVRYEEVVSIATTSTVYEWHAHRFLGIEGPSLEITPAWAWIYLLHAHDCKREREMRFVTFQKTSNSRYNLDAVDTSRLIFYFLVLRRSTVRFFI
jgi:hypothetical protein